MLLLCFFDAKALEVRAVVWLVGRCSVTKLSKLRHVKTLGVGVVRAGMVRIPRKSFNVCAMVED